MQSKSKSEKLKDTGNSKGLSEGVEGRAPGDLPGGDVSQHKAQLVQQVPHLRIQRTNTLKQTLTTVFTSLDRHLVVFQPEESATWLFSLVSSDPFTLRYNKPRLE